MPRDRVADEQREAAREQQRTARAQRRVAERQLSDTTPTETPMTEPVRERVELPTQTEGQGVESGAVAPDYTDPVGDPHPPTGVHVPDTEDEDAEVAFDPTTAGGPIPEGGCWYQLPPFFDVVRIPELGFQNDPSGDFVIVNGTHVPADYVQQVRIALRSVFPPHQEQPIELHSDPNVAPNAQAHA